MPLFSQPSKDPLWKDEFSVFTADERYVSRRQLTKFLTLTSLGMFEVSCGFWFDRGFIGSRLIRPARS